ncbi:hypothetical protein [Rhodoferax sp.]|uniref:hypothetical protein n=1 Tax=Rhodoferax sp. TaxID=50421 RepID=UPI0025FB59D4|nr:hypothetical protein [Rhodoferax sp.]MCM2339846.1 hypothetical protein [Rhodoferax sp.]
MSFSSKRWARTQAGQQQVGRIYDKSEQHSIFFETYFHFLSMDVILTTSVQPVLVTMSVKNPGADPHTMAATVHCDKLFQAEVQRGYSSTQVFYRDR